MAMLAPHVGEQFQRLDIRWINTGEHQIDSAAFDQPDCHPVVGRLVDLMPQRFQHR